MTSQDVPPGNPLIPPPPPPQQWNAQPGAPPPPPPAQWNAAPPPPPPPAQWNAAPAPPPPPQQWEAPPPPQEPAPQPWGAPPPAPPGYAPPPPPPPPSYAPPPPPPSYAPPPPPPPPTTSDAPPAPPASAPPLGAAPGTKTCPQCQTPNGAANRFCEGCGFQFPAEAAPPPPQAAPPPPPPAPQPAAAPPAGAAPAGVSLVKGGNVSLVKAAPGLTHIMVGLGWSARTTTGADFDLDASALACNGEGRVLSDSHFVFFNNLSSPEGAVRHAGDNRTGDAQGDDEVIHVDLSKLPAECARVVFAVTIYDESQNFGQVRDAYIRVANEDGGAELARYDLSEDASVETAMVFGELYRGSATEGAVDWKFRAVGQGYANGLAGIARDFGVNLG